MMNNPSSKTGRQILCDVVENVELTPYTPDHFRLTVDAPYIADNAKPGQFIHILPPSGSDLFRRPISIMKIDPDYGHVTVVYRIIGEGTRLISGVRMGERLDLIGPLGNGFPILSNRPAVLMGGGVGIPPLVFLARELIHSNKAQSLKVILGAREPGLIICMDEFQKMEIRPDIYVESGIEKVRELFSDRAGRVEDGLITHAFDEIFDGDTVSKAVIYACGPIPMLNVVVKNAADRGLECYVSLENKLACGLGACLGCSVPVRDEDSQIKYERVCTEGPVFDGSRVAFDRM